MGAKALQVIPEHFLPTSRAPQWQGKIRCAYCMKSGWPLAPNWPNPAHWSHRHGEFCVLRPKAPVT